MSEVYLEDARNLKNKIKPLSLDVTITSPPYFDMKDYDHPNQIGYGQKYNHYLEDLGKVFKDVYDATKESGSLWVIIDTFKRNGSVVPLPFDFSKVIMEVGWKLQDIIIWKKDKTVPWSKKGSTKKIFEYILFFSKGNNFKYYSDRTREIKNLKEWWIRYPERYNPAGKSLEEIWEFNIPTQGSWGDGYIRHFCPLPADLVRRIITLTTDVDDVVFDPFSGSGTVPAQAAFMRRKYYGFELNEKYIKMFKLYLEHHLESQLALYDTSRVYKGEEVFRKKIIDLRVLKYGRVLSKKMKILGIEVDKIWIEYSHKTNLRKHDVAAAKYVLLCKQLNLCNDILLTINEVVKQPPLSKFGILADFVVLDDINDFLRVLPESRLFVYTDYNTHQYTGSFFKKDLSLNGFIFSSIEVNIEEAYNDAHECNYERKRKKSSETKDGESKSRREKSKRTKKIPQ